MLAGRLSDVPVWPRVAAVTAVAIALVMHARLLGRVRAAEPAHPWWFGYARDGGNAAAVLMLWGAYLGLGLPGPAALLAAMLTALVTYLLDWLLAVWVGLPPTVLVAPLTAWAALLAAAPARLASALGALLRLAEARP